MTRHPTARLVGVPEGARLRVLRIIQASDRVADVDSDIASARRACAQLGLTPSRTKTVQSAMDLAATVAAAPAHVVSSGSCDPVAPSPDPL